MAQDAQAARTRGAGPETIRAARRRYALSDLPILLWRERTLVLAVFLGLLVLGLLAAATLKTRYEAYSSVLVRPGQEYVYAPASGDEGRGAILAAEQIVQSESEILGAAALKARVLDRLGLARTYPKLARRYAKGPAAERKAIMAEAVRVMERDLTVVATADTPIVRVSFSHENPQTASLMLNALLEEYLIFRRVVLVDSSAPALAQQRRLFEIRLAETDAAYQDFLASNRIGDFVAEKASLSQLQAQIELQKRQNDTLLQDRIGRLGVLERQLRQIAPEVGLYRDIPGAGGEGVRRVGVNPVHQTIQTEKVRLTAEVAALRRAQAELTGQVGLLIDQRLKLAALEPRFLELSLSRDVLQTNIRDFAAREERSRAAEEMAGRTNDSIRIVQRAVTPSRGESLRRPVLVLALLVASLGALGAGLVRMSLRPGLPTARTAARTLGLPLLGAAALKQR